MDTIKNLSLPTRSLHWVIAVSFIALTVMGIYMANTETFALFSLHKSLGNILFIVILLRVGWRAIQGWPKPLGHRQKFEQLMARIIHWILLLGTLAMPISGMLYSGMGGRGFGMFGWILINSNDDPNNPGKVIPYNKALSSLGEQAHEIIGYTLVIAIALHIIGACKHHFLDKDRTLLRMLGK